MLSRRTAAALTLRAASPRRQPATRTAPFAGSRSAWLVRDLPKSLTQSVTEVESKQSCALDRMEDQRGGLSGFAARLTHENEAREGSKRKRKDKPVSWSKGISLVRGWRSSNLLSSLTSTTGSGFVLVSTGTTQLGMSGGYQGSQRGGHSIDLSDRLQLSEGEVGAALAAVLPLCCGDCRGSSSSFPSPDSWRTVSSASGSNLQVIPWAGHCTIPAPRALGCGWAAGALTNNH